MRTVNDATSFSRPGGVSAVQSDLKCSACVFGVWAFVAAARIDDMHDEEGVGEADEVAAAASSQRCILSSRFSTGTSEVDACPG